MKKRGQVDIGPKEVMFLILAAGLVITSFVVMVKLGKGFFGAGEKENEAAKATFLALEQEINRQLDDENRYSYTENPILLFLGDDQVLTGFNYNHNEEEDVDDCYSITGNPAYRPFVCQGKACLVLYSDDTLNDEDERDNNILASAKFDQDIYFVTPESQGDSTDNYRGMGIALPLQNQLFSSFVSSFTRGIRIATETIGRGQEQDHAYLVLYGQCGGQREFRQKPVHIEKFIDNSGQIYITLIEVTDGNREALSQRVNRLKSEFIPKVGSLQQAFDESDYVKVLDDAHKEFGVAPGTIRFKEGDRDRAIRQVYNELIQGGQLDDLAYLLGRTLWLLSQDFDAVKRRTPTVVWDSIQYDYFGPEGLAPPRAGGAPRIFANSFARGVYDDPTTLKDFTVRNTQDLAIMYYTDLLIPVTDNWLATFHQVRTDIIDYLGIIPTEDAFDFASAAYSDHDLNRLTKRYLAENFARFASGRRNKLSILGPLQSLTSQDYDETQRKEDIYLLIDTYLDRATGLRETHVNQALRLLQQLGTFDNPNSEGKTRQSYIDALCSPNPSVYFTADDFSGEELRNIGANCVRFVGVGDPEQQLTFYLQESDDNFALEQLLQSAQSSVQALAIIKANFLSRRLDDYVDHVQRVHSIVEGGKLSEQAAVAITGSLQTVLPAPSQLSLFNAATEMQATCNASEWANCIQQGEALLVFFPVSTTAGRSTDYDNLMLKLAEAYAQQGKQSDCITNIINQVPSTASQSLRDQLGQLCPQNE